MSFEEGEIVPIKEIISHREYNGTNEYYIEYANYNCTWFVVCCLTPLYQV